MIKVLSVAVPCLLLSSTALAGDIGPRFGATVPIGWFQPGPSVAFGGALQGGIVYKQKYNFYAELGGIVGVGLSARVTDDSAQASVSAVGDRYVALMAEYDLGPFFVGAGPTLSWIAWAGVNQYADGDGNVRQQAVAAVGSGAIGLQARTGFWLGKKRDGIQKGTTLALSIRATNAQVTEASQSTDSNGNVEQRASVGDRAWGFAPMFEFGYTFK